MMRTSLLLSMLALIIYLLMGNTEPDISPMANAPLASDSDREKSVSTTEITSFSSSSSPKPQSITSREKEALPHSPQAEEPLQDQLPSTDQEETTFPPSPFTSEAHERNNINNDISASTEARSKTNKEDDNNDAKQRYVKIDAAGNPLPENANTWSCVLDTYTQLLWEIKNSSHPGFSADTRYRWEATPTPNNYTDENPLEDIHKCPYFSDPGNSDLEYCTTHRFKLAANMAVLCGSQQWDLPSPDELQSLVIPEKFQPAIDENYFPDTKNGFYWTNENFAYTEFRTWAMNFTIGKMNDVPKQEFMYVRLVARGDLVQQR